MAQNSDPNAREGAYIVFAGCPNLVMDLEMENVLATLQKGLEDTQSIDVRLAAMTASVAYLSSCDVHQLAQSLSLMFPILNTLPSLPHSRLPKFLSTLNPLCISNPNLFAPHLPVLLTFLPAFIIPSVDPGPTPTISKPFPTHERGFLFPPVISSDQKGKVTEERDEETEEVRKAALELMVSLSEARPAMVKRVEGWIPTIVKGCLEGMAEMDEDATDLWLEADPSDDPTDDDYPHDYEQSLDRIACSCGGQAVLPSAFQQIPAMMNSHDWRLRHAGLMAIAAVAEGTSQVMLKELGKVVDLVIPMFSDRHPRVRHAACQCVGQLCTDLEEVIQAEYHQQLFSALIPTLEAPESRVHSHAAAALINFCEGIERDTLVPYLDPIVERLLKLLDPPADGVKQPKRYVQEQVITTLAMVADASELTFAKHYSTIMPLLLNVLQNAKSAEYRKLRVKSMECAGLIAIAVGRETFRPDSRKFIELLMEIQNRPVDPEDTMIGHYLVATWAKVCQALGPEFEPYLPVVMPPLLHAASAKADVSVYTEDEEQPEDREGWETISMDGHQVGIRTSVIEEKCQAFETLIIYASTLGASFAPYLSQSLELVLPSLRFYFHDGVREACAMLIPMLLVCGKNSGTLTNEMVTATLSQLVNCIAAEGDSSFLASLYKSFRQGMLVIGGPPTITPQIHDGIMEATRRQLQSLADKRKARAAKPAQDIEEEKEDLMLLEEMEDFALEDMGKMLATFNENHELLMAVSSVRDLALGLAAYDEEEGEEGGIVN